MPRSFIGNFLFAWLDNHDDVQAVALRLLYLQIFVGIVGSLGAMYTGVITVNVVVALFALVAVASGYQFLTRAYAVLLFCMILLDAAWFSLFAPEIWILEAKFPWEGHVYISIVLAFFSQCVGCFLRVTSFFLWIQMYRLGLSDEPFNESNFMSDYDYFARINPPAPSESPLLSQSHSMSGDFLGSSIYNPSAFANLIQKNKFSDYIKKEASGSGSVCSSFELPSAIPELDGMDEEDGLHSHLHFSGNSKVSRAMEIPRENVDTPKSSSNSSMA